MTMRRRRFKRQIRRVLATATGSATAPGGAMIDATPGAEVAANADSQSGSLLIVGIATSSIEGAVHRVRCWTGRTSTAPSDIDRGMRIRDVPANPDGIPFVLRFNGLRLDPGDLLKLTSSPEIEESSSSVHKMTISHKWAFTERNQ